MNMGIVNTITESIGSYYTGTQVELLYVLTFGLVMLFSILAVYKKMSVGIALVSLATGIGIAWLFAPYMAIAIAPIVDYVVYGYTFTWQTGVAMAHLGSLFAMVIIAGYNLLRSGGRIIWA